MNEAQHIDNMKRGTDYHREMTKDPFATGRIGEVMLTKWLEEHGISFTESPTEYIENGGDGGKDVTANEYRIDSKYTTYTTGTLLVESGHITSDIYTLATPNGLVGWIWAQDVAAHTPRYWPRDVLNHIVEQSELRPMSELVEILK